jgi:hypothetical protein
MKREASALTGPVASAPCRASLFPTCFLHAEANLKPKKDFKEASLRTNVAGACGLALVRCSEMAFSSLGKDSSVMMRIKDACTGESPQDVESLLAVLRESHEELCGIRKGISKIANMGSRIDAGSFTQGIEDLRHLVLESTAAKQIRPTLEVCKPSLTHLFGDNALIKEALEVAKFKPYQATSYRPKSSSSPRSSDAQEGKDWKKKPYQKSNKSFNRSRSSGKGKGPTSKKGEGQKKK